MTESDDIARRAAQDVARLLDRRGLPELAAVTRQVHDDPARRRGVLPGVGKGARWTGLYPPAP